MYNSIFIIQNIFRIFFSVPDRGN